jgi:hypothetical protein
MVGKQKQKERKMETIQMHLTKREVAEFIVVALCRRYTNPTMDIVVGITADGKVDRHFKSNNSNQIVIPLDDTTTGWTYGDFIGDIERLTDWSKNWESLIEGFETVWISEAIHQHNYDHESPNVEWPT